MPSPADFAYDPKDSAEIRLEKTAALLIAGFCTVAGLVWAGMYYAILGPTLTTLLPLAFSVIVGAALVVSHVTRRHHIAVYAQIICIIYITALIQWSIGGVVASGYVLVWAFLGPLASLMFFSTRETLFWFALYLLNVVITVAFNGYFSSRGQDVSENTALFFFLMNFVFASIIVFGFAGYFVRSSFREHARANRLLLNVLPREIAPILKANGQTIADHFDSASVLFADIAGSTPLFAGMEPDEVVDWLNDIFSRFDRLVDKYELEKIRTVGDNYMVAAGVPTPRPDHATALAAFALEMVQECQYVPARNGQRIAFRVGINSGPLVAGVIGKTKFHYDIWGDTVNVASRMESHGVVGRVQISESTRQLLGDAFQVESRGLIEIKGKGEMETWFLVGG